MGTSKCCKFVLPVPSLLFVPPVLSTPPIRSIPSVPLVYLVPLCHPCCPHSHATRTIRTTRNNSTRTPSHPYHYPYPRTNHPTEPSACLNGQLRPGSADSVPPKVIGTSLVPRGHRSSGGRTESVFRLQQCMHTSLSACLGCRSVSQLSLAKVQLVTEPRLGLHFPPLSRGNGVRTEEKHKQNATVTVIFEIHLI